MKHQKRKLGLILLFSICIFSLQAQTGNPCAGGNYTGSGGTVSSSFGQVFYTTFSGSSGTVAQGVQQPFEISIVEGAIEASKVELVCSIYPNPTSEFVKLKLNGFSNENLSYQLFDINGKLIDTQIINSNETFIGVNNYSNAIYFLKLIQDKKELKSFKIIKN